MGGEEEEEVVEEVGEWQQGLFNCLNDVPVCLVTFFAPCYTFGVDAGAVGENCMLCACIACIPWLNCYCEARIRGKIRSDNNIGGVVRDDYLIAFCCPYCALCQEYQEVHSQTGIKNQIVIHRL